MLGGVSGICRFITGFDYGNVNREGFYEPKGAREMHQLFGKTPRFLSHSGRSVGGFI